MPLSLTTETLYPLQSLHHRQRGYFNDVPAIDGHCQRFRLEPLPPTNRAGTRGHILLNLGSYMFGLCLSVATLQIGDHSLIGGEVPPDPAEATAISDEFPFLSIEDKVEMLLTQGFNRHPYREAIGLSQLLDLLGVPGKPTPGLNSALGDGEFLIGDDQLWINLYLDSQAGADWTGPVRAVEAEVAGGDLAQADPAVDAGEMLGEKELFTLT